MDKHPNEEHDMALVEINWNNMNSIDCMVWKYYVRYREVGTPNWTTKSAGVGNGLCNFGLNTTTKTLQLFADHLTFCSFCLNCHIHCNNKVSQLCPIS